ESESPPRSIKQCRLRCFGFLRDCPRANRQGEHRFAKPTGKPQLPRREPCGNQRAQKCAHPNQDASPTRYRSERPCTLHRFANVFQVFEGAFVDRNNFRRFHLSNIRLWIYLCQVLCEVKEAEKPESENSPILASGFGPTGVLFSPRSLN